MFLERFFNHPQHSTSASFIVTPIPPHPPPLPPQKFNPIPHGGGRLCPFQIIQKTPCGIELNVHMATTASWSGKGSEWVTLGSFIIIYHAPGDSLKKLFSESRIFMFLFVPGHAFYLPPLGRWASDLTQFIVLSVVRSWRSIAVLLLQVKMLVSYP